MGIPEKDYDRIAGLIESEKSVVGIDAKQTHILIIYMLEQMDKRIAALEQRLDAKQE